MCTPTMIASQASSGLFEGVLKGIGALNSAVTTISGYKANKENYAYRTQIALNNAKIAQNEALRQKQLGIEKARLEKINALQDLSKMQARNSASNFDAMSQTNKYAYQDMFNISNVNAKAIDEQYSMQSDKYFNQATNYLKQADDYKRQHDQSVFNYSFNALGKFKQVADDWYQKRGEG